MSAAVSFLPPRPGFGPLCVRGLHEDIPENVYHEPGGQGRRCRPCRLEYMRLRRRGQTWLAREQPKPETGPLTSEKAAQLRALIPCLGCGVPPERTPSGKVLTYHGAGCPVPHIREGDDQ